MESIAERLAGDVTALTFERLPPAVVEKAKQCLLDHLGVALLGATLPNVSPALRVVRDMGGRPESTIVYFGDRTTPAYASFVNATFGHSCEFDDAHWLGGHPGVCTIPVALALGERFHLGGKDVITAVVAGYQATVVSCAPIHRAKLRLGWHPMKVAGVFGAAATAARLLGLGSERTAHALAIAASEASGTMEYDQSGGEVKRVHAGFAVRSGLEAALLAESGLTGPRMIFEGKRGVYRLFGGDGDDDDDMDAGWANEHQILDTTFKLYPCVGTLHAALDALTEIMNRQVFAVDEVDEVVVYLADWAIPHGATIRYPSDVISAQFSLAFSVGLRLVRGSNALSLYTDPVMWRDSAVLEIAGRVNARPLDFAPGEPQLGSRVVVHLKDGRRLESHQRAFRGHHTNPATTEELTAKFREVTSGVLPSGRCEELIRMIGALEDLDDVATLMNSVVL
jgi:2-methylcitrate dehydratase PrpD